MDIVEEFLELTRAVTWLQINPHISTPHTCQEKSSHILDSNSLRHVSSCVHTHIPIHSIPISASQVSVATLVQLFGVLRSRIPGRHLPILISFWWNVHGLPNPKPVHLSLLWLLKRSLFYLSCVLLLGQSHFMLGMHLLSLALLEEKPSNIGWFHSGCWEWQCELPADFLAVAEATAMAENVTGSFWAPILHYLLQCHVICFCSRLRCQVAIHCLGTHYFLSVCVCAGWT